VKESASRTIGDAFGMTSGGMEGQVKGNPLANWSALASYKPPDPLPMTEREKREDWEVIRSRIFEAKRRGLLT